MPRVFKVRKLSKMVVKYQKILLHQGLKERLPEILKGGNSSFISSKSRQITYLYWSDD